MPENINLSNNNQKPKDLSGESFSLLDLTKQMPEKKEVPVIPRNVTSQIPKETIPIAPVQKIEEQITQLPIQEKTINEETTPISSSEPKKKSVVKLIVFWLIFSVIIFPVFYVILNFPALWSKLTFFYKQKNNQKPAAQKIIPANSDEELLFLQTVMQYIPTNTLPTKKDLGLENLGNDRLSIPKLDIGANIVWDSPVDEPTMLENLKHGVVHYQGTAKPGEKAQDGEGNVFISGHSSYYWWDDGKYKTVFVNLDALEPGDQAAIGYKDDVYVYKVVGKEIINNPDDENEVKRVLAQNTSKPTLSLMTCVPVGTNAKRLIVKLELIAHGTDKVEPRTQTIQH